MNGYNTYVRVGDFVRETNKYTANNSFKGDLAAILNRLEKTQIRRCWECENASPNGEYDNYYCVVHNALVDADDFCSW